MKRLRFKNFSADSPATDYNESPVIAEVVVFWRNA